jgi:hypothetical protein
MIRSACSWHRFATLALAALAVLARCAAKTGPAGEHGQPDLIRLTVNEIRRPINALLIRQIRDLGHRLRWSQWRRRHQARAVPELILAADPRKDPGNSMDVLGGAGSPRLMILRIRSFRCAVISVVANGSAFQLLEGGPDPRVQVEEHIANIPLPSASRSGRVRPRGRRTFLRLRPVGG